MEQGGKDSSATSSALTAPTDRPVRSDASAKTADSATTSRARVHARQDGKELCE